MAPELLQGSGPSQNSDIFSLGSLLYSLLTHQSLFKGDSTAETLLYNKFAQTNYVSSYLKNVALGIEGGSCSNELINLVTSMLSPYP